METTNEVVAPAHYNPNQLVTYKVIEGDNVTYPTDKVTTIEYALENARYADKSLARLRLTVSELENKLVDWIDNDSSAAEIVSEICALFDFNPTREVEFEGTFRITGTVDVPLAEIATFDIQDVDIDIDVNSYSHNIAADVEVEYINTI